MSWKHTVGQSIRRLTAEQAREKIHAIQARGATIEQPIVRCLTGGYASQTINFYVIRKLAEKAGIAARG